MVPLDSLKPAQQVFANTLAAELAMSRNDPKAAVADNEAREGDTVVNQAIDQIERLAVEVGRSPRAWHWPLPQ